MRTSLENAVKVAVISAWEDQAALLLVEAGHQAKARRVRHVEHLSPRTNSLVGLKLIVDCDTISDGLSQLRERESGWGDGCVQSSRAEAANVLTTSRRTCVFPEGLLGPTPRRPQSPNSCSPVGTDPGHPKSPTFELF